MKREMPPGLIVGAIVVVVLIVALFAYRTFGGNPAAVNISPQQLKDMQASKLNDMTAKRDATGHPIPGTSAGGTLNPGR